MKTRNAILLIAILLGIMFGDVTRVSGVLRIVRADTCVYGGEVLHYYIQIEGTQVYILDEYGILQPEWFGKVVELDGSYVPADNCIVLRIYRGYLPSVSYESKDAVAL